VTAADTEPKHGVIVDQPGLRVVDTRELKWEDGDAPMLARSKTLSLDEDGDGIVAIRWLAAYDGPLTGRDGGFRLATEYYFLLGEEFTHWELDPDLGDELLRFRRGFWMDRRAGNLTTGTVEMPVGSRALGFMIAHEDPFVGTVEAAGGSPAKPLVPDPNALVIDRPLVTVVDSHNACWEPHPTRSDCRQKVLSATATGDVGVSLLALPPGMPAGAGGGAPIAHAFREFALVLEGSVYTHIFDGPDDTVGRSVVLSENFWLDRGEGVRHIADTGGPTGATLLHFRTRPGVEFVKTKEKYTRWTRTRSTKANPLGAQPATESDRRALIAQSAARRLGVGTG
jgi:hypothetical protein